MTKPNMVTWLVTDWFFSVDQNHMEGHQKEISPFISYLIGLINNIRQ